MGRIALVSVSKGHPSGNQYAHRPTKHQRSTRESYECIFVNKPQIKHLQSWQELNIWLEKGVSAWILSLTIEVLTLANSSIISSKK